MSLSKTVTSRSAPGLGALLCVLLSLLLGLLATVADAAKRCPKCHRTYSNDATFCPRDGTTLVAIASKPSPPVHHNSKPPHHEHTATTVTVPKHSGGKAQTDSTDLQNEFPLAGAVVRARLTSQEAREMDSNLIFAVRQRDAAKYNKLLQMGADINARQKDGETVLMVAAANGDSAFAETILQRAPNLINATTSEDTQFTALMLAARNNSKSVINLLVSKGATVDAPDKFHKTALTWAAISGSAERGSSAARRQSRS